MATLEIKDLHVSIENKNILKGVNLTVNGGEVHAIMGPNGTGKSTLASALMGNPKYEVTQGEITLDGLDVLDMEVDERARAGLFLAMQYPAEVPGVTNSDFKKLIGGFYIIYTIEPYLFYFFFCKVFFEMVDRHFF
jgi:Fe-S cluster assembly ATP-binding protein